MEKIKIELSGQSDNRIQPFIMISGDDSAEQIFEKFLYLKDMGIYSAVLQYTGARKNSGKKDDTVDSLMQIYPFDDTYFQTLGFMSKACRALGMTYWVQDGAPFPTGAANGAFMEPENLGKGKIYLEERHTNLKGPLKNAAILAENFNGLARGSISEMMADLHPQGPEASLQSKLLGAILIRYMAADNGDIRFDGSSALDVTDRFDELEGIIRIDVPEGLWRLFFFYETYRGGRKYYMNLLDEKSVRFQIDRVLQLHYNKLKNELGVTWEGFFYDEPEVGNTNGYDFHCLPGNHPEKTPFPLPWCSNLPEILKGRLGDRWLAMLPSLWYECGEDSRIFRFHYMDIVTRLISENYNGQIWPWCQERNIRYIGHVLEDENSHARLGCGTGHFFRIEKYQDMSGVDLIAGQVLPGMDMYGICNYGVSDGDGCFYHYGLAKLASSEAHINPNKKGSFCEVNAVYGNVSNAKFYKFLLDHLFVNGIDHLIPVITDALVPEEGSLLWNYANRMCLLLENSKHKAQVAVLYHAESEWAGKFQYFHKPAKELATHQISYDVIPGDVLVEKEYYQTRIEDGIFYINDNPYEAIVVPYCEYLRKDVFETILEVMKKKIRVYFVESLPTGYCEVPGEIYWNGEKPLPYKLENLAAALIKEDNSEICCSTREAYLRCGHWKKDGKDYFLLVNEEPERRIETEITFPVDRPAVHYDVMNQKLYQVPTCVKDGKTSISLKMGKYESRLYIFGDLQEMADSLPMAACEVLPQKELDVSWEVALYPGKSREKRITLDSLGDLSVLEGMGRYTEKLIYATTFLVENASPVLLDLGNVCDSAFVTLNDQAIGLCIAAPYVYDISKAVCQGLNKLQIEVLPSAARRRNGNVPSMEDKLSAATYMVLPQMGLLGPVTVYEAL